MLNATKHQNGAILCALGEFRYFDNFENFENTNVVRNLYTKVSHVPQKSKSRRKSASIFAQQTNKKLEMEKKLSHFCTPQKGMVPASLPTPPKILPIAEDFSSKGEKNICRKLRSREPLTRNLSRHAPIRDLTSKPGEIFRGQRFDSGKFTFLEMHPRDFRTEFRPRNSPTRKILGK